MGAVAAFCAAALRALALSLRIRSASSSEIPLSAARRAIASLRARAFASLRAALSAFAFSSAARAAASAFAFSSAARAAASAFAFSSAARASASAFAFSSAARASASAFAFSSAAFLAAIFFARCLSRFHCFLQLWQIAYSLKIGSPFSLVPICLFCKSRSFPHIGHFILIMYSSLLYQNIYNRLIIAS